MWRALVESLYPVYSFFPGASAEEMEAVQQAVGCDLPTDLRELLAESNGVEGEHGLDLVWPTSRMVTDNLALRGESASRRYMPLDHLVFFADAGNGDLFGFAVENGSRQTRDDVFVWNPIDDGRAWVAPDLRRYLQWWADGRIKT